MEKLLKKDFLDVVTVIAFEGVLVSKLENLQKFQDKMVEWVGSEK